MGTHIKASFQALVKLPEGGMEWRGIASNYDERQHYNLYAWLADVRNYSGITPISNLRGCPDDIYHSTPDHYDRPSHWLLGSEIIEALDRIHPVTESGVVSTWAKQKFNEEPDCYSRHYDPERHFLATDDVIKRDTGYAAELWELSYTHKRLDYACSPGKWVQDPRGGMRYQGNKNVRRAPELHRKKLIKYAKRVGKLDYKYTWVISPRQRREEFQYFTQEIARLMHKHGEIRMLMEFC